MSSAAVAQVDPGNHSAHHPEGVAPPPEAAPVHPGGAASPVVPSAPRAAAEPNAGCVGMMGCMGKGPRPFYAALLEMPTLTPEARRTIEAEAQRRIGWGTQAVVSGAARVQHALGSDDPSDFQQAIANLREGVQMLESGTAALRAVEAGSSPRQIALTWFRDQLSLPVPEAGPTAAAGGGVWGLSWYHLIMMAFLVAFLLGTLALQYARMRRIAGLAQRLAPGSPGRAPGLPAGAGGAPPNPGPPAASGTEATALATSEQPLAEAAVQTPTTSPSPSPAAAAAAAKRPWSGLLRLAAVFPETANVKTFRLMNPEGGDVPFAFMPGQFLTFSAKVAGERARRAYTIASSPTQRSYVEVTVKREEQGLISRHLHDRVSVGALLEVSAPAGVFTFTGTEADSIVLIAGGVGITPMMSVTRYLTDRSYPGDIYFLYGARTTQDFVFREELEYLQKRHANLHVAVTMSRATGSAWMGPEGPISKEFIERSVSEVARRRVHLCGPPPMMEAVKAALAALGVPKEQIKTEAFGPARGVSPGAPAPLPPASPAPPSGSPSVPSPAPAASPVPRIATAEVHFTKSAKTGALAPDETVLEAAEAIGVPIDYSCRIGICGACKVPLLKGEVAMEVEEGLPPDEKAKGIILACQAKSLGNLEVEA
ncbi:2Fe-2S iron-sulfur cluster-binding protein [Roseomonas chloroacetimidivorans]|uniref:2Fe-2S iron-sulfur cluster-binding protein n=1 Tax=Roseomonas chloroacetimidivorans TaxID=1766656 RepID=UPI003C725D91